MKKLLLLLPVLLIVWCANQTKPVEVVEEPITTGQVEVVEIREETKTENTEPTTLEVSARFTDEFIENYRYEESCNYRFALWVDVKWNWDLFFYDVYRKDNGWVDNDISHWLTWAIPACEFTDWVTWAIPLTWDVSWANHSKDWLGYHYRELWDITEDTNFGLSWIKEWKDDFYVIRTEIK